MNARIEVEEILYEWRKLVPYLKQNAPDFPEALLSVPKARRRVLERRIREVRTQLDSNPERESAWHSVAESHVVARLKKLLDLLERKRAARRAVITLSAAVLGLLIGVIALIRHWQ